MDEMTKRIDADDLMLHSGVVQFATGGILHARALTRKRRSA
jgi:hypothetical protein